MGGHAMMTGSVLKNLKCYYCMYVYLVWTIWDSRVRTFPHFSNYYTTSFSTPPSPSPVPTKARSVRKTPSLSLVGPSFSGRPELLSVLSNLNFFLVSLVLTAVLTASRLPQLQLSCHFDFLFGYLRDSLGGFSQATLRDGGDDGDDAGPIANLLR